MTSKRTGLLSLFGAIILSGVAHADDPDGPQKMLAVAKMAGACGILDSMIQLQSTTKMQGGDEFVARFWAVEAARLGLTVVQLSETCTKTVKAYDQVWKAAASDAK
jgi:hypothetical protein